MSVPLPTASTRTPETLSKPQGFPRQLPRTSRKGGLHAIGVEATLPGSGCDAELPDELLEPFGRARERACRCGDLLSGGRRLLGRRRDLLARSGRLLRDG